MKQILVTNIKITGCNLTDEQIEDKIEQGDMTGFSSILEVNCSSAMRLREQFLDFFY